MAGSVSSPGFRVLAIRLTRLEEFGIQRLAALFGEFMIRSITDSQCDVRALDRYGFEASQKMMPKQVARLNRKASILSYL